jgi:hypothetical protein
MQEAPMTRGTIALLITLTWALLMAPLATAQQTSSSLILLGNSQWPISNGLGVRVTSKARQS